MLRDEWYERFRELPFVDSHCHVAPQQIGRYAFGNRPFAGKSPLAGLLLGYGSRLCFLAAGIPAEEVEGVWSGAYSREECKHTLLRYLPLVETMPPVAFCLRGLSLLAGHTVELTEESWDETEALLLGRPDDAYAHLEKAAAAQNLWKTVQNLWAGWGASYYGRYRETWSERERRLDEQLFVTLATFDSHAVAPFTDVTREYARLVGGDGESFAAYDRLLEELARLFVVDRQARGFKISECYFRPLDYEPVSRRRAEECFKEERTSEEQRDLSNYITWKVLTLAREYRVPVQIHTGELWGEAVVEQTNPMYLKTALEAFPDVQFDLLHGGYPYVAELGILGTNFRNVRLNLSYMPLRSLTQFRNCLELYSGIASAERLSVGTDVFDVACMTGCIDFIRGTCAGLAAWMEAEGLASPRAIQSLFEKILYQNAAQLYRL